MFIRLGEIESSVQKWARDGAEAELKETVHPNDVALDIVERKMWSNAEYHCCSFPYKDKNNNQGLLQRAPGKLFKWLVLMIFSE